MRSLIVMLLICGLGWTNVPPVPACSKPADRAPCCPCNHEATISGCCCTPESPPAPPQATPQTAPSTDPAVLPGGPTSEGPESAPRSLLATTPDGPDARSITPLFLLTGAFLS